MVLAYEVQGTGDDVVLVHYTTGSRQSWAFVAPHLAGRWRLVLPDLPGSGETVDDGGPLELDELADAVVSVADDLGLRRFHLAGHSLGAAIAAVLAARCPARVRSLALVCGWVASDAYLRFQFDVWRRLFLADRELFTRYAYTIGVRPDWFEVMGEAVESLVAMGAAMLAPGSDRQCDLDGRVDISTRLGSIGAPTLVIGARHDRVLPFEQSEWLARDIPHATLAEVDCGHLVNVERPEELAGLLDDFFTSNSRA